jgi:hypothetical protein
LLTGNTKYRIYCFGSTKLLWTSITHKTRTNFISLLIISFGLMRFPLFCTSLVMWFPVCFSPQLLPGVVRLPIMDLRSGFRLTVNPVSTTTHVCTIKVVSLYSRGNSTSRTSCKPIESFGVAIKRAQMEAKTRKRLWVTHNLKYSKKFTHGNSNFDYLRFKCENGKTGHNSDCLRAGRLEIDCRQVQIIFSPSSPTSK